MPASSLPRCSWVGQNKPYYEHYHDEEWGVPVHDDRLLFEMLILEGAQAGLSWETVLKKRDAYRAAFHNFDPSKVAAMTDEALEQCLSNAGLIRHRLKIFSVRKNARIFIQIQQECGSFDTYLWRFVNHQPQIYTPATLADTPTRNAISDALSKDLKKRGMSFVGSTIIYAYMQAIGMVNNHMACCFKTPCGTQSHISG